MSPEEEAEEAEETTEARREGRTVGIRLVDNSDVNLEEDGGGTALLLRIDEA